MKEKRRRRKNRRLELAFYRLWLRLNPVERQRVVEEFAQPVRRQWFIVDEHGVRWLE